MSKPDEKLHRLLRKPENIRAALEIEQQMGLLRKDIAKDFVENVATIIQTKKINLSDEIRSAWKAFPETSPDGTAHVEIRTFSHKHLPNYKLRAEYIFTLSDKGWCGWCRPSHVDLKLLANHETFDLSKAMINNGYSGVPEVGWLGADDLRGGRHGYVLSDINDIMSCFDDNQSNDHPLAQEIAEELWTMFDTYREQIEALDSFNAVGR